MKNITKLSVLIFLMIFTISCKKSSTEDATKKSQGTVSSTIIGDYFKQQGNIPFAGHISMFAENGQTRYNRTSSHFSLQGELPSVKLYSNISFNNYLISLGSTNSFLADSHLDTINLEGHLNNYFGASTQIKIDGKVFISDFYVPSPVVVSFPNNSNFIFDKNDGIDFSLKIDENNENPIVVVLAYNDDDASDGDIVLTKTYILDAHESTFTIPASDLADFPLNNHNIVLNVGCGDSQIVTFEGLDYDLLGISLTYLPGIILQ